MPRNLNSVTYKTFCWNIGTTSFRTCQLNRSIEQQLQLLSDFWTEHEGQVWDNDTQAAYYALMHDQGFTTGREARPDKAARQKTSALVDLGIVDDSRHLTAVGDALLDMASRADHAPTGFLHLPPDSQVYLQQLLKTTCPTADGVVRPLSVVLHLLSCLGALSEDEFTYLAPLAITPETTEAIIQGIGDVRAGRQTINDIIYGVLLSGENYQQARRAFLSARTVTMPLMCSIGLNRKSRDYDKPYHPLYLLTRRVFLHHDLSAVPDLYAATRKFSNVGKTWRALLFDTTSVTALTRDPEAHVAQSIFAGTDSEADLRERFFRAMHVVKARYTLHDYADLNRRYLRLTNIFRFADARVELDIVPKHFFRLHDAELYTLAFNPAEGLTSLTPLPAICPALAGDEEELLRLINEELGTNATDAASAQRAVEQLRYQRLDALIDQRFTDDKLLALLDAFDHRDDPQIFASITDGADAPTCFEYVLGIIWYKVSGRQGRVLDYMKLSLDADLLPVSHAAGGEADIVYEYAATPDYPAHHLLLEATLAEHGGQRRMEMEPVSRHLGMHILRGNTDSYTVFATTSLDPNVVSDFHSRSRTPFFDPADLDHIVPSLMIIPLDTADLRRIIRRHASYAALYRRYRQAYAASGQYHNPLAWREACVAEPDR